MMLSSCHAVIIIIACFINIYNIFHVLYNYYVYCIYNFTIEVYARYEEILTMYKKLAEMQKNIYGMNREAV